jgi:hypothetical protein
MGRIEMHVGFWWKNQKERDHWEDSDAGKGKGKKGKNIPVTGREGT